MSVKVSRKRYERLSDVVMRDGDVITMDNEGYIVTSSSSKSRWRKGRCLSLLLVAIILAELVAVYFAGDAMTSRVRDICSLISG